MNEQEFLKNFPRAIGDGELPSGRFWYCRYCLKCWHFPESKAGAEATGYLISRHVKRCCAFEWEGKK